MARDYAAAVAALNTLQSNFKIVDAIRKSGRGMNQQAIPEMIEWCRKIGYEPSDLDRLRPIHIAGTKGKGSTSAFISSILSQYLPSRNHSPTLRKIGLYTSPHLRFVRERIQINNEPLSEETFTKYFFEVWDRLEDAARKANMAPDGPGSKPVYFRYLTLMAFHTYMSEGVDTAVIECGIGGEYDSTNIIVHPTVTAVTSLGIDHTAMLGNTLPEIAWHKAGVFKAGSAAYTAPQPEEALAVLRNRAQEKDVKLTVAKEHPEIGKIKLGLDAEFQKINASLAIQVAAAHLRALGHPDPVPDHNAPLPAEFRRGLEQVRWPGRCEIRLTQHPAVAWFLDGAHTLDSIEVAGAWFTSHVSGLPRGRVPRMLLFNQQTRDRDPDELAKALHKTLCKTIDMDSHSPFTHVVFCTNVTFKDSGYKPDLVSVNSNAADVKALSVQNAVAQTWHKLDRHCNVRVEPTIEEAIAYCRTVAENDRPVDRLYGQEEAVHVLVTGSLHLVGGVIDVLESETGK